MSKKNLCVLAAVLIAISAFLPYLSVSVLGSTLSKSLIDGGDGIILLVIAVIAIFCAVKEKYVVSLIMGAISVVMFFVENSSVQSSLNSSTSGNALASSLARSMIQNGIGYYLLIIGAVALIVFSFMGMQENKTKKQD